MVKLLGIEKFYTNGRYKFQYLYIFARNRFNGCKLTVYRIHIQSILGITKTQGAGKILRYIDRIIRILKGLNCKSREIKGICDIESWLYMYILTCKANTASIQRLYSQLLSRNENRNLQYSDGPCDLCLFCKLFLYLPPSPFRCKLLRLVVPLGTSSCGFLPCHEKYCSLRRISRFHRQSLTRAGLGLWWQSHLRYARYSRSTWWILLREYLKRSRKPWNYRIRKWRW